MADYSQIKLSVVVADDSTLLSKSISELLEESDLAPTEFTAEKVTVPVSSSVELNSSGQPNNFLFLAVRNTDSTNYVDVAWTDTNSNANTQRVTAGRLLVIPGLAAATAVTITGNATADVVCRVITLGN